MSTRALRRAQKELEERRQLEQLAQENDQDDSEEEPAPTSQTKASLFAMLGGVNDNEDEEDEEEEDNVEPRASDDAEETEKSVPAPRSSKKSKKKKKKGRGKAKETRQVKDSETDKAVSSKLTSDMDEIDRALLSLNLTSQGASSNADTDSLTTAVNVELQQAYEALAIDTQYLHAANEMRKLFGRAAFQHEDEQPARQRGRGQQQGLAGGRNAPGGRNLASIGLRRNIFIQGKEEWPRATLGGLGMELVEKRSDGTVEYRFIHTTSYQRVQKEFEGCVASMDPQRMLHLLHYNPSHISTLLQVSEIAKQQRDSAAAGDYLERALFNFGRAIHSTFSTNLSQGKARLDFRRPENREFWLAGWRYISTLGVRATWRTAFEWSKLLLSLSPEEDPYCIRLMIDQLAIRGRALQQLVDLVDSDHLQRAWKIPPNLAFSVALAHDALKNPEKARSSLQLAMKAYPWVASGLCKELEISPTPKTIWGILPNNDFQQLLQQLYVTKAKSLWDTTAGTSLLVEVAYSFDQPLGPGDNPYWLQHIDERNLARHVILSEDQSLISLLDPRFKELYTSVSDPLPPVDSVLSYQEEVIDRNKLLADLDRLRTYFTSINLTTDLESYRDRPEEGRAIFIRALEEQGTNIEEFRLNTHLVQVLRRQLHELGVEVIFQAADHEQSGSASDNE